MDLLGLSASEISSAQEPFWRREEKTKRRRRSRKYEEEEETLRMDPRRRCSKLASYIVSGRVFGKKFHTTVVMSSTGPVGSV